MPEKSYDIIASLQKKWMVYTFIFYILIAAATVIAATFILQKFIAFPLWLSLALFVVAAIVIAVLSFLWKIKKQDVVSYLDKAYPELNESSGLLLKPHEQLNLIESLQLHKTDAVLYELNTQNIFIKIFKRWLIVIVTAIVICVIVSFISPAARNDNKRRGNLFTVAPAKILPGIKEVSIQLSPPAYTHEKAYKQSLFDIKTEEGSIAIWQLTTSVSVNSMQLIFSDSILVKLQSINNERTLWQTQQRLTQSGFYQVKMDNRLSDLYRIEVIKDEPPDIIIHSPEPKTTLSYGEPETVNVRASVSDDYGIKNAIISATTSSGSGEAVKFKEQIIAFPNSFAAQQKQYDVQQHIDPAKLGMQPGDELYFYIKATDNNNHEKRSDVFIVAIEDTTQYTAGEGLIGAIKLKGDALRSQRQIIIETEQLIKDKPSLPEEKFKDRSNNIGLDQRALRLEFGQYLGEEDESGGSQDGVADNPAFSIQNFGNANAVLDAFTDKHDNAEDATFFDMKTKNQLKAMLTEMWNAELRLRTFKPNEALSFENKALLLFKELQQKSRVYVPKTTFKTTPLDPAKRLTGDLSKITSPSFQSVINTKEDATENLRNTITVLQQLQTGKVIDNNAMQILQQTNLQLSNKAATELSSFLPAVAAIRNIISAVENKKPVSSKSINIVEAALQKLLQPAPVLPFSDITTPDMNLSDIYYKKLNNQ